jgi:hypothetical protein
MSAPPAKRRLSGLTGGKVNSYNHRTLMTSKRHPLDHLTANGRYLPRELRDFHDQKDLFKTIEHVSGVGKQKISWIDAHIFTIDIFLWFMARRGYLLKKTSSKKYNFKSLEADISSYKEEMFQALRGVFYPLAAEKEQEKENV